MRTVEATTIQHGLHLESILNADSSMFNNTTLDTLQSAALSQKATYIESYIFFPLPTLHNKRGTTYPKQNDKQEYTCINTTEKTTLH